MKVFHSAEECARQPNTVVTVGTFDGLHRGHQAILSEVKDRAAELGCRSVVVTFDPHPREVVGRGPMSYLTTLDERLEWIAYHHIDVTVVVRFTRDFSQMEPREFYNDIVVRQIGVREVIVGHDHMFGRDRKAGFEELQTFGTAAGFTARVVPPVSVNGTIVSSSLIRKMLERGEVGIAMQFLGRPYELRGSVVPGDGRGRELGFPTANIQPAQANKLIPASGVYVVRVSLGGETPLYGMLNIGSRPTFGLDAGQIIEVHVFGLNEGLYGRVLRIHFLKRLRNEQRFPSKTELIAQLQNDERESKQYISEIFQSSSTEGA